MFTANVVLPTPPLRFTRASTMSSSCPECYTHIRLYVYMYSTLDTSVYQRSRPVVRRYRPVAGHAGGEHQRRKEVGVSFCPL